MPTIMKLGRRLLMVAGMFTVMYTATGVALTIAVKIARRNRWRPKGWH